MKSLQERKCICVLGMHRSGTSTVAGILQQMGFFLGKKTYHARYDNPKGFFENIALNVFNDKILSLLDSTWYTTPSIKEEAFLTNLIRSEMDELERIIDEEFGENILIAIKDPRLSILFPIYYNALKKKGIETYCMVCLRNPFEIANSLKFRDNLSFTQGLLLWMDYTLKAEYYSRQCSRGFTDFDKLVKDPVNTMQNCFDSMQFSDLRTSDFRNQIESFVDSGLKHNFLIKEQNPAEPLLVELYHHMQRVNEIPFNEYVKKIDLVRECFYNRLPFYTGLDVENEVVIQIITKSWKMISHRQPVRMGENRVNIKPVLNEPVSYILLKPSTGPCIIRIDKIKILGADNDEIIPTQVISNERVRTGENILVFTDILPEIRLQFDRFYMIKGTEFEFTRL